MANFNELSAAYIRAWCEEWEVPEIDRQRLLEMYATDAEEDQLLDYMAVLAKCRQQELAREGRLVSLNDFLRNHLNWSDDFLSD